MLHYVARINRSTSRKCGESQWRRDHWKAKDVTRDCKYLNYLKTIDVDYMATWKRRYRYKSTISQAMATKDRQCGAMNRRSDYKPTTDALIGLRQEQGRQHFYIQKNERSRERPFDQELQAKLQWLSQKLDDSFRAMFFLLIIFAKLVAT